MSAFAARRDRLRERMAVAGCEAMLIADLTDVLYFSGFSGSNGALLITMDDQVLATDGRYEQQASRQCPDVSLRITRQLVDVLLAAGGEKGLATVGFDPATVVVSTWRGAGDDGSPAFEPVDIDLGGMRKIKDDGELQSVRRACEISVTALEMLLTDIGVGMTELEVARLLELNMGRLGAQDRSFETIVATGPNSAVPHHEPTERTLAAGDLLKIDFGAMYDGYHADCTRTFVVASQPQDWQAEIHAIVAQAQQAGMDALAPGLTGQQVDAQARAVVEAAGYADNFVHGLGHGVGLQIHEPPFLGPTATNTVNTVEAQVPLTVEPGIYLPGRGGVRIEDTLIVGQADSEILTTFPRDLSTIG